MRASLRGGVMTHEVSAVEISQVASPLRPPRAALLAPGGWWVGQGHKETLRS